MCFCGFPGTNSWCLGILKEKTDMEDHSGKPLALTEDCDRVPRQRVLSFLIGTTWFIQLS